jgi:hypothetical protein
VAGGVYRNSMTVLSQLDDSSANRCQAGRLHWVLWDELGDVKSSIETTEMLLADGVIGGHPKTGDALRLRLA